MFSRKKSICSFLTVCLFSTLVFSAISGCGAKDSSNSSSSVISAEHHSSGGAGRVVSSAQNSTPSPTPTEKESSQSEVEIPGLRAILKNGASLYAAPSPDDVILYLDAGTFVSLTETKDPLWYSAQQENGMTGYLYAEELYRIEEDGNTASKNMFQETANKKLAELQERLPEGKYWNHMWQDIPYGEETPFLISDTPCEHSVYGELYCNFYNGKTEEIFYSNTLCQCLGFASLLSDQLFGFDAPLHVFYDIDLLRVGDHIRLHEYEHSMTVVGKYEDGIIVGEANENYEDCLISWTRQISYWELEELAWDSEYISRYPMYLDEDGAFIPWEE